MDPALFEIGSNSQPNPPNVTVSSTTNDYLNNPFPMFEHVGVNEVIMYGEGTISDDEGEGEEDKEEEGEDQEKETD